MSCVLTHCFSSILLGIYSTQKTVPLVQSLEDIINNNNNELIIIGYIAKKKLEQFNHDQFEILEKRFVTKKIYK